MLKIERRPAGSGGEPPISTNLKTRRAWFAVLYALATFVVQAAHDHGPRISGSAAVGLPSCDDPRPHFAGHSAPEVLPGELHCLACQFRAEHQVDSSTWDALSVPSRRLVTLVTVHSGFPSAQSRPPCRAPPLA
jgi:hypothetical protein